MERRSSGPGDREFVKIVWFHPYHSVVDARRHSLQRQLHVIYKERQYRFMLVYFYSLLKSV